MDELRIGDTFADVSPHTPSTIREPVSILLATGGLIGRVEPDVAGVVRSPSFCHILAMIVILRSLKKCLLARICG